VGIAYNVKKENDMPPGANVPVDAEAEFDDPGTIEALRSAIESAGYEVALYEADADLPRKLAERRPGIVFNIAESINGRGREAQLPALLNYLGIPFTGSDETAMCVALDKALCKRLLTTYRIATPKHRVARVGESFSAKGLRFPLIVKPNAEGSGKGIADFSIVRNGRELLSVLDHQLALYRQEMLVEEYIEGREFTVGLLGNGDGLRVFPPMEIRFNSPDNPIYSYTIKKDFRRYVTYACPPDLEAATQTALMRAAERAFRALGCRDCARVDFRLSREGKVYFIEINPLPGLAPGYSDYPMIAEFCGMSYDRLIRSILECALERVANNG
jgi:D-alanine-D-alanine ligase